jgi:hypothetical protein
MLWLPTPKRRKAIARLKRRRRRRFLARLLLFLFILLGLGQAAVAPEHTLLVQVKQITAPFQFDFVDWESQALVSEFRRRLSPPPVPAGGAKQMTLVETYLDRQEQIGRLNADLDRLYARCPEPTFAACPEAKRKIDRLEHDEAGLKAAQAEILPQVETILVRQTEAVLREEGFTLDGRVFPPVAFRLLDPPTALILSPRDRIENQHIVGLSPQFDPGRRADIEQTLDRRGDVSSYVTNVGGLGSYPTMVLNSGWLPWLVEVIAHEWTHNYLYTFPTNIAWGYQSNSRLTTLNETTADLVGKEIGRKVISRYYPAWIDRLPPLDASGQPALAEPSEFDLALRRIRQRVDRLLAAGQIEEAEAYMEAERLKLVEKGYNLRKLNQAYFAFHGSYALSPASVDPIGPQLRRLRAQSPALKDFLNEIGWLNSYEDYLDWLDRAGIEE